ncbi:MAG: phosphoribosyltransferase family protein [Actinomycetota bacterium]
MAFDLAAAKQALTDGFPVVADHPDVAGLLRQPELLAIVGPALVHPYREAGVTAVMAPEARGPIVAALAARELDAGLVLARKEDRNHPGADLRVESQPTWRGTSERFQARSFDLAPTDRVLIVDDWVTTGNSIRAVARLVERCGAQVVGAAAIVDKADPETVRELHVHTLVPFAAIGG